MYLNHSQYYSVEKDSYAWNNHYDQIAFYITDTLLVMYGNLW